MGDIGKGYKWRSRGRSGGLDPKTDCFGEVFKIVEVVTAELIHDVPVYELVAVDSDVSEPDRFRRSFSEGRVEDLQALGVSQSFPPWWTVVAHRYRQ